ncbi:MAG: ATP-binding protein, partial [Clostridiales bacterium]|nr:ATP-binding protein [Clostridiales bacterium]
MNKDKITAMCHKVSVETGLTFNSVMTYYFLESVLSKLSNSKYNDKFIFKGGYIPFEKEGSQLLFQIISECYEKRSVILTTNLEFSKWDGIF